MKQKVLVVCSNCEYQEGVDIILPVVIADRVGYLTVEFCPNCLDENDFCELSKYSQGKFKAHPRFSLLRDKKEVLK